MSRQTWIFSDGHLGHDKIIEYCNRPFKDSAHMDEELIRRWNARVQPGELVYHLGDVGWAKDPKFASKIARLNGHIFLIVGNHDKSSGVMVEKGCLVAVQAAVVTFEGMTFYLNHRPLAQKPDVLDIDGNAIDYVLHGHIHNSTEEDRAEAAKKKKSSKELVHIPDFNVNLSCEMTNYEPITMHSLVNMLRAGRRPEGPAGPSNWKQRAIDRAAGTL